MARAVLEGAKLTNVTLDGTDLRGASLVDGTLCGIHSTAELRLDGAWLTNATFCNVTLKGISLAGAHLDGAQLFHVSFAESVLTGVSFRKAAKEALLSDVNLQGADPAIPNMGDYANPRLSCLPLMAPCGPVSWDADLCRWPSGE